MTNLFAVKSNPARVVAGIDPRLNQTALSLLSLMDDVDLREELSEMLRAKQSRLTADRARSTEARTLTAITAAFKDSERMTLSLREIADSVNANGDELDETVSARQIGYVLRARSIPLKKSNGAVVLERSAVSTMEASSGP
ncbi:MAG: hypothetical protein WCA78_02060 [Rhizomicrobium sp.]